MIKVGITGQSGFLGTHLYNTLGLRTDTYKRIPFSDDYFTKPPELRKFVSQCDAIVHLAAMNRHKDPEVIYNTNIELAEKLISACEETGSTPHILFSSSIQEEQDNLYGKSKKEGRKLFEAWADKNDAQFSGILIPNIFGPFGQPYYNSVVATFCHQIAHNEKPQILKDSTIKLIYVGEVVSQIISKVKEIQLEHKENVLIEQLLLQHTTEVKVSVLLQLLESYKEKYVNRGEIPDLSSGFRKNLFNTFLCYLDLQEFFPFHLKLNTDNRGSFVETLKLSSGGQVSFSTTVPGITRGNHFHTRKAERFAVIKGKAKIDLRRIGTENVLSFELDGKQPSFVDMPIWYTHNITNVGDEDLYTLFWINEHFNEADQDTFYENVNQ